MSAIARKEIGRPFWLWLAAALLLSGLIEADGASITGTSGDSLPAQAGQSGKFLTTNGTISSWATLSGGGDAVVANSLAQFAATTSLELKGVISDETGSGALVLGTSPVFTTQVDLAATGVRMTPSNGSVTFLGLGDGADEDLKLDLNTTSNVGIFTSSTSLGTLRFGAIVLETNTLTLSGTGTINGLDAIDATSEATIEAAIDTLANLASIGGSAVAFADAGADALWGWDDSASTYANLSAGDAKTALSLNLVENTALSTWAGTSSITTVGTVTSGTFSGVLDGTVTLTLGSDATGDVYYRNASGFLTRLAKGTDGQVLKLASGLPSWAADSTGTGSLGSNLSSTTNDITSDNEIITLAGTTESLTLTFTGNTATFTSSTGVNNTVFPGTVTTTTFAGVGGGLTLDASGFDGNLATTDNTLQEIAQKLDDLSAGGATAYDDIGDPDANSTIAFAGFTNLWTSSLDGGSVFSITNSDADAGTATYMLDIGYTDSPDAEANFIRLRTTIGGTPVVSYLMGSTAFTIDSTVATSFAGTVAVPTIAGTSDSDTSAASTGFVQAVAALQAKLAGGNTFTDTQVFPSGQAFIAPALGTIASGVGTTLTALNGENIQDDTIDDDSIDFGTGADQVSAADIPIADTGSIFTATDVEGTLLELAKVPTKNTATSYTIGTTDARELYGGVIYVTGAATITIPAVAAGASFTVITIGAVAVSVDPNASDLIYLNGTALSDGDKVTNASTTGDMAVFTYYDATGWYCSTNTGWTDGN